MSTWETRIPDLAHGDDDLVRSEVRGGRVFHLVRTESFGEHFVFLTVAQAKQVAQGLLAAAEFISEES